MLRSLQKIYIFKVTSLSETFNSYHGLFDLLITMLNPPDLVVYLRSSVETLQARINQRARDFESTITAEYLDQLNMLYEEWIAGFHLCPVLSVPADAMDFVTYPGHLDLIAQKVEEKLRGKEEVVFNPEDILRCQ